MDPWYSLGSHDMPEVAQMGLHVGQLTGRDEMRAAFAAVTVHGARTMGLDDYGIEVGKRADLVVLQASDPIEALRLRANRLFVIRRGEIVAESAPLESRVVLDDRTFRVDFGATPASATSISAQL